MELIRLEKYRLSRSRRKANKPVITICAPAYHPKLYLGGSLRKLIEENQYRYVDIYTSPDYRVVKLIFLKEPTDKNSFSLMKGSRSYVLHCKSLMRIYLEKGIKRPAKIEVEGNEVTVWWW